MLIIGRKASAKGTDRSSRLGRWALAAAVALTSASMLGERAFAAPQGGKVVVGTGSIQTLGNATTIRASNGAVIQYGSFNLANGESVRFIQPSTSSVVLNRIVGATPSTVPGRTTIDGLITANGRVYFVNPSGVVFGAHSVINVASLYAAAGDISNTNFRAGRNTFTIGTGDLVNQGKIQAGDAGQVHLLGHSVLNAGTIVAPRGVVTMTSASGDVSITELGGVIAVKVSKPAAAEAPGTAPDINTAPAGTQNNGTIQANGGVVKMIGAGDIYSLAVKNAGLVRGADITIDSGKRTGVVAGRIEAISQGSNQQGGNITITGDRVIVNGATIDASGVNGGGNIKIGGDFHGGSTVSQARRTGIMPGSTIKADTTGFMANAGNVVIWSTEYTYFNGRISARSGSGIGGMVEVSSRGSLVAPGTVDVGTISGTAGTILYDPRDITIQSGGAADDAQVADKAILFGDGTPVTDFTINQATLEGLAGNIILQAQQDVKFNTLAAGTLNLTGVTGGTSFVVQAGRHIVFQTTTDVIATNGGNVHLEADSPHTGGAGAADGTGTLTLGGITTGGGNVTLIGADFALNGTINAGGGTISVGQSVAAQTLKLGSIGGSILNNAELGLLQTAGTVTVGRATTKGTDGAGTGASTITSGAIQIDQVDVGAQKLALVSSSTIDDAGDAHVAIKTTGTLTLTSGGAIGSQNGAQGLNTDVGTLAVTSTGGSNLTVTNAGSGALTLNAVATGGAGNVAVTQQVNTLTVAQAMTTTGSATLQAAGAITVNSDIAADTSVSITSGTSGAGDLSFGAAGVHIDSASISMRAGDGVGGGGTTAKLDVATNSPLFRGASGAGSPTTFVFRQDGAIADGGGKGDIPLAAQFGAAIPANYTIQSDDKSVTVSTAANVAGSGLTLIGNTAVTIGANISVASLTASSQGSLTVNGDITSTSSVTLSSGLSGTGDLSFGAGVNVNSATTSLQAGDGNGGAATTAKVNLITNAPVFRGAAAGATTPTTFSLRQDASIADGGAKGDIPAVAQFGSAAAPTNYSVRSDDGSVTVTTAANVAGSGLTLNGSTGVGIDNSVNLATLVVTGNLTLAAGATAITTATTQQYNGSVTLGANTSFTGTTMNFVGGVAGATKDLTLDGGAAGVITLGSVSNVGTLTLTNSGGLTVTGTTGATTVTLTDTTGAITFGGAATIGTLNTANKGYSVAFNGGGTVTNAANFLNTGTVTFGDGAGDSITFTGGVATAGNGSNPSSTHTFGTVGTTNTTMNLGPVTLDGNTTLNSGGGTLGTGAVTGATKDLTLNGGAAGVVTLGSVSNVGTLTLTNSGGLTVTGTTGATTVTLTDTTGAITFGGAATIGTLNTANKGYSVAFNGGGTVTNAANFLNTGTVTFGDGAGDSLTFTGGVATAGNGSNPSSTHTFGTVGTTNTTMNLGPVTLDGNTTLNSGGGTLGTGAVTGATKDLTLDGGAAGVITLGSVSNVGTLTLTNSGGLTVTGTTGATTVTLTDTTGAITFGGAATIGTLNTANKGYSVAFNGGGTVTNAVNFLNTGTVTFGDGAGDSITFTGGVATAGNGSNPNSTHTFGTVGTTNTTMNLGPVTLDGNTTLNSGGGTLGTGAVTGATKDLTLDGGAAGVITLGSVSNVGTLTLTNSGGLTVTGATGATTVTLTDTTGTITFGGAATIGTLNTANKGYSVAFNGGGTVTNAVNFLNTGTVTFGDGAGDNLTFTGGVATAGNGSNPSSTHTFGTVGTTNTTMNLGPVTLDGNTTLNSGGGTLGTGAVTGATKDLTLDGGAAGVITLGSVSNVGTLTLTNSGGLTVTGATGATTVTLTDTTGTITFGGAATIGTLNTANKGYSVAFNGGGTVTNAVNFLNTGTVTFGDGAGDNLTFTGGVATAGNGSNPNSTHTFGTVGTTNTTMNLGPVTLDGNTTLNSGGGTLGTGAVTGGTKDLTLNGGAAGVVTLGSVSNVGTLTLTNSGGLTVTGTTGATTVTLTDTTGAITFGGAATIGTLNTANKGYSVAFNGGGTVTNAVNFLNTGTVTFGDGAGDSLTFTGGVATAGNGSNPSSTHTFGAVSTSNAPMTLGVLLLDGDSTLTSGGGKVWFQGTVDSTGAARSLAVVTSFTAGPNGAGGDIEFGNGGAQYVGRNAPLASVTTTSAGAGVGAAGNTIFNITPVDPTHISVITTLGQTYNNPVQLSQDTSLKGSSGGFGSTVTQNGHVLTLDFGTTVFGGGNISGNINAIGALEYTGDVTLTGATTIVATAVTFDAKVDGAFSLTIGGGGTLTNAVFGGFVGSTAPGLASVHVFGTTAFNAGNSGNNTVTTTGNQQYDGNVTLGGDTTLSGNTFTFGGTINDNADGVHGLTVIAAAGVTFNDNIGLVHPPKSLAVQGGGTMTAGKTGGLTVATRGNTQTYDLPITLTSDATYSDAGGGSIVFNNTIDSDAAISPRVLVVNTNTAGAQAGNIQFGNGGSDYVGATFPLFVVTTSATGGSAVQVGSTVFDMGDTTHPSVTALVGQIYTNPIQLQADTKLAGPVQFGGDVTGIAGARLTIDNTLGISGSRTITVDKITFSGGASSVSGVGGSALTIQPTAVAGTIGIGDGSAGTLQLTNADVAALASSLNSVTIGRADGTGLVTIASTPSFGVNTTIQGGSISGVGAILQTSAGANLSLQSHTGDIGASGAGNALPVRVAGSLDVNTSGGSIFITSDQALVVGTLTSPAGASTVQLTTTGAVDLTMSGSTTDDNVTLTAGGVLRMNGVFAAGSLDAVGTGGIVINAASITTAGGTQQYTGTSSLGATTNLTGTAVTFGNTLTGNAHDLTVTGNGVLAAVSGVGALHVTGNATFGGNVTAASVLVDGTSAINAASITTAGGTQQYTGISSLGATTNLTGTAVTFGNTLTGNAHDLTVTGNGVLAAVSGVGALHVTGNATFGGNVTAASVLVDGTSAINAASITTAGGTQQYTGISSLGATTNLTGTTVTFGNTLTGNAHDLTVTGNGVLAAVSGVGALHVTGNATFGGNVTAASVLVDGTSAINAASITTAGGTQQYTGISSLGATTNLTGTTVTFGNTLTGNAHDLTVTGNGVLAAVSGVGALHVTGNATFGGIVTAASVLVDGTSAINAASITTAGGTQQYTGISSLGATTNLTGTTVTFGNTLTGNAHDLTVTGNGVLAAVSGVGALHVTGNATFGGNVTAASVLVDGTSAINAASITTAGGTQQYTGISSLGATTNLTGTTVTFGNTLTGNAHDLTVTGNGVLAAVSGVGALHVTGNATFGGNVTAASVLVDGTSAINAASITTAGGTQQYTGISSLGATTNLTGTAVTFGNTLTGNAHDLTVTGNGVLAAVSGVGALHVTGNATFGGIVTAASVLVDGTSAINAASITTAGGTQQYTGISSLGATTNLTGTTVTFGNTLTGNAHDLTVTGNGVLAAVSGVGALHVTGNATFGGNVTAASVLVDGTSAINAASITTAGGTQQYTGISSLGATTNLTGTTVTFGNTLTGNAHDLTVTGNGVLAAVSGVGALHVTGNATFGGNVTAASVLVDGTSAINAASITTAGGTQQYTGISSLGATTNLTGTTVTFGNTLTGNAHDLTVTGNGVLAAVSGVGALHVTGNATFGGNVTAASVLVDGTSAINAASITTAGGTQQYTGISSLGATTNLTGTTVTFGNTLTGNAHDLTVTGNGVLAAVSGVGALHVTGNATFGGNVTAASVLVDGTSAINAASITTAGGTQQYTGISSLGATTNLTGTTVTFGNTLTGNAHDLTVTGNGVLAAVSGVGALHVTGNATFGGNVTAASVLVDGTSAINAASITTAGGTQQYTGTSSLGATTNLTGTTVTFGNTLTGNAHDLTVTGNGVLAAVSGVGALHVTGNATFGGNVTAASVLVDGTSAINAASITTAGGTQQYTGAVTLGAGTSLVGTTVTFNNTVNGAFALAIGNGGTATNVVFGDSAGDFVGNVGPGLASVHVFGTTTFNAGNTGSATVLTTGTQTYDGAVTLNDNTTLGGSAVAFNQAVSGGKSLLVNGSTSINGGSVTTTGTTQEYNGPVTLGANTTLTGTVVRFDAAVSGTKSLLVNGSTLIAGPSVTTTGTTQEYNGPVTLAANATLTGTSVTFDQSVSGNKSLLVHGLTTIKGGAVTTTGTTQEYDGAVTLVGQTILTGTAVTFDQHVTGNEGLVVRGNTLVNGSGVVTHGAQEYDGIVTLGHDATFQTTGLTRADYILFGGNVVGHTADNKTFFALTLLTVPSGGGTTDAQVFFIAPDASGKDINVNVGRLLVNNDGKSDLRTHTSPFASICVIAGTPFDQKEYTGSYTIQAHPNDGKASGLIDISRNERITALGSLDVRSDTARLSDITTLNDLNIYVNSLTLKRHASEPLAVVGGGQAPDNGASYVVGKKFTNSGFVAAPSTAQTSGNTLNNEPASPLPAIRINAGDLTDITADPAFIGGGQSAGPNATPVTIDQLRHTGTSPNPGDVFTLEAKGVQSPLQPVVVVNQVQVIAAVATTASDSAVGELEKLGIIKFKAPTTRPATDVYDDVPLKMAGGGGVEATDFLLTRARIKQDVAERLIRLFYESFPAGVDKAGKPTDPFVEMKTEIEKSAAAYKKENKLKAIDSTVKFRQYVDTATGMEKTKLYMDRMRAFFNAVYPEDPASLGGAGLSSREAEASRRLFVSKLESSGEFEQISAEQVIYAVFAKEAPPRKSRTEKSDKTEKPDKTDKK